MFVNVFLKNKNYFIIKKDNNNNNNNNNNYNNNNNNNGNVHFIQYKSQVKTQININARRMSLHNLKVFKIVLLKFDHSS